MARDPTSTGDGPPPADASLGALQLLNEVARLCNEAGGVTATGRRILGLLCDFGPWDRARAYVTRDADDAATLRTVARHPRAGREDDDAVLDEALAKVLDDLAGAGRPVWQRTIVLEDDRAVTTTAIPMVVGEFLVGAIVLVSGTQPPPPEEIRRTLMSVAIQYGGLVARRMADRRVAEATASEQARIGRDLHDSINQDLAGVALSGDALERRLRRDDNLEADAVAEFSRGVRRAIDGIRDLVRGLVPLQVGDADLAGALGRLADRTSDERTVRCSFSGGASGLDEQVARELYFIGGEAVRNALDHAEASTIDVRLSTSAGQVVLEVTDDGRGMPASARRSPGRGLTIMRHRAQLIDGGLEIDSTPGRGTTVRCCAPLTTEADDG